MWNSYLVVASPLVYTAHISPPNEISYGKYGRQHLCACFVLTTPATAFDCISSSSTAARKPYRIRVPTYQQISGAPVLAVKAPTGYIRTKKFPFDLIDGVFVRIMEQDVIQYVSGELMWAWIHTLPKHERIMHLTAAKHGVVYVGKLFVPLNTCAAFCSRICYDVYLKPTRSDIQLTSYNVFNVFPCLVQPQNIDPYCNSLSSHLHQSHAFGVHTTHTFVFDQHATRVDLWIDGGEFVSVCILYGDSNCIHLKIDGDHAHHIFDAVPKVQLKKAQMKITCQVKSGGEVHAWVHVPLVLKCKYGLLVRYGHSFECPFT